MNKKENTKKFTLSLFALVLGLVIISVVNHVSAVPPFSYPNCPSTEPGCNVPINEGSSPQVKNGSLSVNSLLVNGAAQFASLAGLGDRQTCVDATGIIGPCSVAGSNTSLSVTEKPDTINSDNYWGNPTGDLINNNEYSKGYAICPKTADAWVDSRNSIATVNNSNGDGNWSMVSSKTITNTSNVAKNYLILASASVTNDGDPDYPILMLKKENASTVSLNTPLSSGTILAYNQIITDFTDYWSSAGAAKGRPALNQISYIENIPANTTENFSVWTTEAAGGCFRIMGGLLQITPMNPTPNAPVLVTTPTGVTPPTCVYPQVLNTAGTACITPALTCTYPQTLNSTGTACVLNCSYPQFPNSLGTYCFTPSFTCSYPKVYNSTGTACVANCYYPQVPSSDGNSCVNPIPTCTSPQVLDVATNTCITPVTPPATTSYTWYKGASVGQTCQAYCSTLGKACVVTKQTCADDKAAFTSAGVSCSSYTFDPGQTSSPNFNSGGSCYPRTSSWSSCSTDQITSTSCTSPRMYWNLLCACQ